MIVHGESGFTGANLSGSTLRESNLLATTFYGTNLEGADFTRTSFGNIVVADTDLAFANGLASLNDVAPSSISIDTLIRSRGNIPEVFLRGAGVPQSFITNMKSLITAMEPIQFYSCFISYSTKDQDFADRLHADLRTKGVRCWFSPHDVKGGRKLHEQIDEAIRVHDKLLADPLRSQHGERLGKDRDCECPRSRGT